uniref:Uncharacterized protein n=1 Tax=viral metagenome TaxID=1070528 RepID=A0A6C0K917_9ZZZZ
MENTDFTFTPKPPKSTRRVAPKAEVALRETAVASSGGGMMDYLPVLIAIGTLAAVYMLYREFQEAKQETYQLGQMVKNMQAKFDETPFMTPDQVFPDEEVYSDSDDDDDDDEDDEDDAPDSDDEEIVLKQS